MIYIALLRGINVGGHKKIKMNDLKVVFENLECTNIQTYIQSGNVVFEHIDKDVGVLKQILEKAIVDSFGFEVSVFLYERSVFGKKYNAIPWILDKGIDVSKMYFIFLSKESYISDLGDWKKYAKQSENILLDQDLVYLFAGEGYGKTKLTNVFFEKKLQCKSTTRNFKTCSKLLGLSGL